MSLKDLLHLRKNAVAQARAIHDLADSESRDLTDDEQRQYDAFMVEQGELKDKIEKAQRDEELRGIEGALEQSISTPERPDVEVPEDRGEVGKTAAFRSFLRSGVQALSADEHRALQADNDTAGGYVIGPEAWVSELIQALDNQVFVRQLATTQRITTSTSLGQAALNTDVEDPDWTAEITAVDEDTALNFGKRELHPHLLSKLIKVSMKQLRVAPQTEDIVRDRFAYKFGTVQENAFLNGDGVAQPLGVFTASANGINTGQDVSTGNTTTAVKMDNLMECKHSLKAQYRNRPSLAWCFNRTVVLDISQMKDGNGNYIWRESTRVGEPDRLLGVPVYESEYAPNTMTTGLYVGIIGCWEFVHIVDALDMQIQRLNELYAGNNQVGFIGRMETDGMPVLEEAFVRVTLA